MELEALSRERIEDFKNYCRKHKSEVDGSYLHEDEDFIGFEPNEENPTYIITDQQGQIAAAASLIIDKYYRRDKSGRFRIFHSEIEEAECFDMLFRAILKHTNGLNKVFMHIPVENKSLISSVKGLGFNIERYSYLLLREILEVPEPSFPVDYEIRPFKLGRDEEAWCEIRNRSFEKLMGSRTPRTPEMIAEMMTTVDNIEGGAIILYHKEMPVGLVRIVKDDDRGPQIMVIEPLAIIPEYQGKGLGRSLLRKSLGLAKEKGYTEAMLSVNAENEGAKTLYLQEGFKELRASVCYKYDIVNMGTDIWKSHSN